MAYRVSGIWVEAFSQAGFGAFDYPASGQWDPGWQVIPGDLNGDGRTDLFLLNAAGVHVSALSIVSGGFTYVGGPQWTPGWTVSSSDLNNDGKSDLFLYNPVNGVWAEAFSTGTADFTFATGTWDPGWSVAVTDFNQDGFGDIILSRADGTWVQAQHRVGNIHVHFGQLGLRLDDLYEAIGRTLARVDRRGLRTCRGQAENGLSHVSLGRCL